MDGSYWILGIVMFLFVLSVKKYNCLDKLRESIEDYLAEISPQEVIEDEDVVALEEIRDMIEEYVIRNPEIFSRLNHKDE
jgi:large-conductance mechanosensitive channel